MTKETITSANRRMACYDCGESGATPVVTTKGENAGRKIRVCLRCAHRWDEFGLRVRDREGIEGIEQQEQKL